MQTTTNIVSPGTRIVGYNNVTNYDLLTLIQFQPRPLSLHRLLPQPKNIGYNLRERTHNLTLATDGNAVIKQNFCYRMLFRDIC